MDETQFTSKISGEVRYGNNGSYAYFQPHDLPFDLVIPDEISRKSRDALISVSNLNGLVSGMDEEERNIFLAAFTLKESVHSSSIEGTRSTISDVYRSRKEEPPASIKRDVKEVTNYMDALEYGMRMMEGSDLNVELINRMHVMLLDGTRGANKSPGQFKTEQNAIGVPGDTLETAKMVPAPPESVEHLMDNLLEYIGSEEDPMIKLALSHYQFEAIHPYRDGNGRIGRLIMMLILYREGLLRYPAIYPSEYFDNHRDAYIDGLFGVSSRDGFEEWMAFFMDGLKEQADRSIAMIGRLKTYRRQLESRYETVNGMRVIRMMFSNPYMTVNDVAVTCEVSRPTALKLLQGMEHDGVLREISGKKRGLLYLAEGVLEILMSR